MMPGWDMGMGMGMGMEFGMGIGMELEAAASVSAASIYPSTTTTASPAYGMYGLSTTDTLRVDDLLDFSNLDLFPSTAPTADTHQLPPPPPPFETSAAARSYADSSSDHHHTHNSSSFTDELYIPCEEAAELEWLSKFVDDSFSDIPYPSSDTGHLLAPSANAHLQTDPTAVPGRGARSKRSRASSTPTNHHLPNTWSSVVPPPPPPSSSTSSATSSSSSSEFPSPKPMGNSKTSGRTKVRGEVELDRGGVRRCTHCASDKTPQWRTGPMGPKTLCNACGVRYKSGRLVPEYRPASSPTFLLTQHSNSHRKVMELRRQKELVLLPHDDPSTAVNAAARPDLLFHDYEVC